MARSFLLTLGGTLAVLATSSAVCLQIIVAIHIQKPALRTASIVAASLESVLLLILGWLAASNTWQPGKVPSSRCLNIAFGFEILVCALASAASAVALAYLSGSKAEDDEDAVLAASEAKLLAASSVAVALAIAVQLMFMILHFVSSREIALGRTSSSEIDADSQRIPNFNIKSIRYSRTSPSSDQAQEMASVESKDSGPSTMIRSRMGTFRTSVSQAIRPSSSKTKLLSTREQRRPPSLDLTPRRSSAENSFDSWDTSSVDAHNRQVVLEMSPPPLKSRGLETIPASPTASRSPSRGTALDLEPPRSLRHSRSYSSSTLRQLKEARLTPTSSANELHIHPLFRSDSPTPPPVATPGTSVVASPNAGQVISRRESMQSLNRMRSGSLPAGRSPLSRQASFESTKLKKQGVAQGDQGARSERKMTPPVPEWLLSPGMRASLVFVQQQVEAEAEAEAEARRAGQEGE
ncbi:hypothetical protein TOPH_00543 [Tolypocladium ophioglossoides CBS 100239]|uniref:Uncharacterized protein n=1 Tax=Tolypocladium ophioglossoides (strain CBS 100239) TaxID=1163406 RepID=A0A0L0NLV5_TOLOC|nr:hypothetical protein TOPH_00543 [Tolypocladium ophioglossoides CBS 100239]